MNNNIIPSDDLPSKVKRGRPKRTSALPKYPLETPANIDAFLDKSLVDQLNQKYIDNQFSNYKEIQQWLSEHKIEVSVSTIALYGANLHSQIQKLKTAIIQAKLIIHETDDDAAIETAIQRISYQKILNRLIDIQNIDHLSFPDICKCIKLMSDSALIQSRIKREITDKIEHRLMNLENKRDLHQDTIDKIRQEIYGLVY